MSKRKYFGTDGIRGKANQFPLTVDVVQALGRAIVAWLQQEGVTAPTLVVGRDTRRSGPVFEAALCAGVCAAGGHIVLVGVVPTPAIAWLTQTKHAHLGVVLSASHNPYQDNGIKLFGPDGYKLSDEQELTIEAKLDERLSGEATFPDAGDIGTIYQDEEAAHQYLAHVKSLWPQSLSLKGMKLVVDAANGAAFHMGPTLFSELGAEVIALNHSPDGVNINEGAGSLHPETLQEQVISSGAALGLAFDGDADRLIVVDEKGQIVDGDQIMTVCGVRLHEQGELPHATIVSTVMSNLGMERALSQRGIKLERTKVGDRYVIARMRELGAVLGGEQSGHLIFAAHGTTGDGLVAAIQLLRVLVSEQKPLSELAGIMTHFPQVLINVKVREKRDWTQIPEIQSMIEASEQQLGEDGRILVRYSGTENKARVMAEGADAAMIEAAAKEIAEAFRKSLGVAS